MTASPRPVALALPLVLVALASACGLVESSSRHGRSSDDARATPAAAPKTVRMAMRLGAPTSALPSHDAYDVEVAYPDSAETAPYLGRTRGALKPGAELVVGSVRTLPKVRVRVNLFSRDALVARCETDTLDLSKTTDARVVATLSCVTIEAGAVAGKSVDIPLAGVVRPTTDLVLEPEFRDAVGDLVARAQDGLLFLNTALKVDARPASAELAFLSATQSHQAGVNATRGKLVLKVTEQASGAALYALEDPDAPVEALRDLLLGKGTMRVSGKMLATVSTGPAVAREYVDATYELAAAKAATLVTNGATRALKATLRVTPVSIDGQTAGLDTAASFEVEFALRDSASRAPGRITIGTYNIENMWDDSEATGVHYEDYASATSNWYADRLWLKKARTVSTAIALAGAPDILVLQEIESAFNASRSLELLKPELAKLGYRYFELGRQGEDNPVAVTTAVVSKFPIVENGHLPFVYEEPSLPVEKNDELKSSSRDPQYAVVDVQGRRVRVYGAHFKSKRSGDESGDRMREATGALIAADIEAARKADPLLDVLVAGDLNTDYTDAAIIKGLRSTGDERLMLDATPSQKLYNLWYELPVEKRGSYSFDGKRTAIDNMFVSDTMFDNAGLRLVDSSLLVVGHAGLAREFLLNADGTPLRWQIAKSKAPGDTATFNKHLGFGFSDHLPLVATFDVLEARPAAVSKSPRANVSNTDVGPGVAAYVEDEVPVCTAADLVINPATENPYLPQNLGTCVSLENVTLPLRREGEREAAVEIGGRRIVIGVTRGFSANRGWLGGTLAPIAGAADVTRLKGRIGYSFGKIAVLVNDTKADIALSPYVTCGSAADVTGKLEDIRTDTLESSRLACLSFAGATADVGAIAPGLSGTQNVGTVRVGEGPVLALRMPVDAARVLFPAAGRYEVKGFGVLDFFGPKKEWQVNLAAFGRKSGAIDDARPATGGSPVGEGQGTKK